MPLIPHEWNVVVAGRWNRAILTPQGIGQRLFGLPQGTPIMVEVPIDSLGPYRVTHNDVTVSVVGQHLLVEATRPTFALLAIAMQVAATAVNGLPETPLNAVGINLQFSSTEPLGLLGNILRSDWDDSIGNARKEIASKAVHRAILWQGGFANVFLKEENGQFNIHLNLERRTSDRQEHLEWLRRQVNEIQDITNCILAETIQIPHEDIPDTLHA